MIKKYIMAIWGQNVWEGIGGMQHPPMTKKGISLGNFFGSLDISQAILKIVIYVALLLLLSAPAKYYVVYGK